MMVIKPTQSRSRIISATAERDINRTTEEPFSQSHIKNNLQFYQVPTRLRHT